MSCCQIPGRSCPREMRPVPMAPTLMRLLGDVAPNTEAGTMAGKPAATDDATIPLPAVARNRRRSIRSLGMVGSVTEGWQAVYTGRRRRSTGCSPSSAEQRGALSMSMLGSDPPEVSHEEIAPGVGTPSYRGRPGLDLRRHAGRRLHHDAYVQHGCRQGPVVAGRSR